MEIEAAMIGAIMGAALGGLIGWAAGRVTKQIEFRFNLLQKLAENYHRTKTATFALREAMQRQRETDSATGVARVVLGEKVEAAAVQVRSCVSEALSYTYLIEAAFEGSVDHWQRMVGQFVDILTSAIGVAGVSRNLNSAAESWNQFARGAVGRLGFWPWGSWRRAAKRILTAGKELEEPSGVDAGRQGPEE